jgi:hypothetical protein
MGFLSQTENYTSCIMDTNSSTTIQRIKVLIRPPLTPNRTIVDERRRDLDAAFMPGEFDVICGKGKSPCSNAIPGIPWHMACPGASAAPTLATY